MYNKLSFFSTLLLFLFIVNCSSSSTSSEDDVDQDIAAPLEVVNLGIQQWANRTLQVKTFQNGDSLFHATNAAEWAAAGNSGTPAWAYPDYDSTRFDEGLYYNGFAVLDNRNLAPIGWELPIRVDFMIIGTALRVLEQNGTINPRDGRTSEQLLEQVFGYDFSLNTRIDSRGIFLAKEGEVNFYTGEERLNPTTQRTSVYAAARVDALIWLGFSAYTAPSGYKVLVKKANPVSMADFTSKTWNLQSINGEILPSPNGSGSRVIESRLLNFSLSDSDSFIVKDSTTFNNINGVFTEIREEEDAPYYGNGVAQYSLGEYESLFYLNDLDGNLYMYNPRQAELEIYN